jgi:hypothetical protein
MPTVSRDQLLELFGYAASLIVAVSLMMRSIVRLRWVNLAGAACFTVYGILIEAFPVAALNFAIVLINLYFLWKMRRTREAFAVVQMPATSDYLHEFLRFHTRDIQRFQPGFVFDPATDQHVLVVLRDLVPAGIVIVRPNTDRSGDVILDFVTPAYRDFKVGHYLFHGQRDLFRGLGFDRLETAAGNDAHVRYLERVGFARRNGDYRLDLTA